jgi:holo-[acyl-carrier protein] synthase
MIFGIGTDIVQIRRIEAALKRSGSRFAEKILGAEEMLVYQARKAKVETRGLRFLASRFAAKEALSKALGLGMRMPMTWRAAEILNAPNGSPMVVANGSLLEWMTVHGLHVRVSISDEADYAVAFVIVESDGPA